MLNPDSTDPEVGGLKGLRRAMRALRHRNFRLLWAGQWARATGLWMQLVATPLLLLSIGGTGIDLGVAYALQFGPILFLAPIGGALADRVDKRRWLMVLQTVSAAQALLFVLVLNAGGVAVWHVFALSVVLGLVNAAEMPTRVSFVGELVAKEDIPNAVALMMLAMNASRIIGPAIAGLLAASFGFGANFTWSLVAAVLTVVLVALIDALRTTELPPPADESVGDAIRAAARYIRGAPAVSAGLSLLGMFGVFGISFQTILPLHAIQVLGLDRAGYGFLLAVMGIGALAAALPMTLVTMRLAERLMFMAPLAFALLLAVLALFGDPIAAFVVIAPLGFFFVLINSTINVTVQGTVPHEFRGRTMGIYVSIMHGGGALGALIMGALATTIGPGRAMLIGAAGVAILTVGLRWWRDRRAASGRPGESREANPGQYNADVRPGSDRSQGESRG